MHNIWLSIVFCAVSADCICRGEKIIRQPKFEVSSHLVGAMVKMLTNCYAIEDNTVVFAGETADMLVSALSSQKQFSIVLLDNKRIMHSKRHINNLHKVHVFVITVSSTKQLEEVIEKIKNSIWWNQLAHSFIIDWSSLPITDNCSQSAKLLYKAWSHNILRAKVMCLHRTRNLMLYSYNPFTSDAPNPWQLENIYEGKNFHPYSVFMREYRDGNGICKNLDFDATKNLGGYRFPVSKQDFFFEVKNTGIKRNHFILMAKSEHIVRLLCHSLNVTEHRSFPVPNTEHAERGKSMLWLPLPLQYQRRSDLYTYPFDKDGVAVMTQFRGHKTQLEKILSTTDIPSRIGLLLVLFVILIFFKYFLHHGTMPAILNVFRIVCDTNFVNIPRNNASRIFLSGVLFFAVTMQGIYQGQLAASLTQVVPLSDVKTKQDLADMNYTVYTFHSNAAYFKDPIFEKRLVAMKGFDCSEYVLQNPMAACACFAFLCKDQADKLKLHLSSELMGEFYKVFVLPDDSPLVERINKDLSMIMEASLILPFEVKWMDVPLSDFEFDEAVKKSKVRRAITLDDLGFAFASLGIGITCACISFIVEIVVHRVNSRITTTKVHPFQNFYF